MIYSKLKFYTCMKSLPAKNKKDLQRKEQFDFSNVVFGKVPPQAKDIEEAILGAIMLEVGAIDKVIDYLIPESFYVEAHQRILRAMLELYRVSRPIDILTVSEKLKTTGELDICGGPYFVTKLTNAVVSSANIEAHCQIVWQKHVAREVIRIGAEMISDAYEDMYDAFDLMDDVEQKVFELANRRNRGRSLPMDVHLIKAIQTMEDMRHSDKRISGVTSGYKNIDRRTFGWQPTDLIILAARPGVGKTAFALNLAYNASKAGTAVGFFSLEMSAPQLVQRLISLSSGVNLQKIQRGQLEEEDMKQIHKGAIQPLAQSGIHIDDTAALNVFELRAKARRLKQIHNVGLIIIDYLQLMSGTNNSGPRNREQEISEISRNVKALAKELNIPIIALSQLSRAVETRGGNKVPQLSDLRESGSIEQDADAVMFIYRPEYHGLHRDDQGDSTTGKTMINFAKYRNGTPGSEELIAQLWNQRFIEPEDLPFGSNKRKDNKRNDDGITTLWGPVPDVISEGSKMTQTDDEDQTFK